MMKNMERKKKLENTHTKLPVEVSKHIYELKNINTESTFLTKAKVYTLQNQLKQNFGYQLCRSSIQYLNLYCEYCRKLKQIISSQHKDNPKHKSYLTQFSKSHSEEHMSKIFREMDSVNKRLQTESMQFSKSCLITFFQLQNFSQDNVIVFLFKKIVEAKNNRLIEVEEFRLARSKKSLFHFQDKENKLKTLHISESRKNIGDRFSKIHFEILALKVIMNNSHPDPGQTNKICQTIKADLLGLFKKIKLKAVEDDLNSRKRSILNRNDQHI